MSDLEDRVIADWGRDSIQHKLYLYATSVDEVIVEVAMEATGADRGELFRCLYGYLGGERIGLIYTRWELRYGDEVQELSETDISYALGNDELIYKGESIPNWEDHVFVRFYANH